MIANELGVRLRQTSGPVLERAGDLAALLTNLQAGDVLFVDEIHRLSPVVEEVLYPALEDFQIDIVITSYSIHYTKLYEKCSIGSTKLALFPLPVCACAIMSLFSNTRGITSF